MKYSLLGETGLEASHVGLGGAQFGIYNQDPTTIGKDAQLVRAAFERGINYFDTSPWYGFDGGQSERTLGEGLKGIDRSKFIMASKIGRYKNSILGMFDFSAKKTEASVRLGLERLQMPYIDIIQVHDFEYAENIDQIITETIPMLDKLRQEGLVKHIGLGSYNLEKIKYVIEKSPIRIETVLNHSCMTLIDQELRDYADFFKEKKIGLINASVLAHGFLIDGKLPGWLNNADPQLIKASRDAASLCRNEGFKIEHLAYGYAAREGTALGVNVLLTGADTIEHLEGNIDAIENGLSDQEYAMCDRLRQEFFKDLPVQNWGRKDVEIYHEKLQKAKKGIEVTWP